MSDRHPMATRIEQSLAKRFRRRTDVLVGGGVPWTSQGDGEWVATPDVFVIFDHPQGAPFRREEFTGFVKAAVFVILPDDDYHVGVPDAYYVFRGYGVSEFYCFLPESKRLLAFHRGVAHRMPRLPESREYVSPLLGVRFINDASEVRVQALPLEAPGGDVHLGPDDRFSALLWKSLARQASPSELEEMRRLRGDYRY